jgi:hypothetical protein
VTRHGGRVDAQNLPGLEFGSSRYYLSVHLENAQTVKRLA